MLATSKWQKRLNLFQGIIIELTVVYCYFLFWGDLKIGMSVLCKRQYYCCLLRAHESAVLIKNSHKVQRDGIQDHRFRFKIFLMYIRLKHRLYGNIRFYLK